LVLAFTLVMALEKFGVNIAALVAGIGVAGVGIGLAMQGVLSNLVAGLTIIFTKPFRIGDYVELVGVDGQVETIELFATTLVHGDRSRVVIPNRKIVGEILHNYGTIRQVDLKVGVAYGTDLDRALSIIRDVLNLNARVLKEPAPVVGTAALADSSIVIAVNPWVALADYGSAQAEINQAILERYRENQIQIALPQREVRFLNNAPSLERGQT
jgi:small conductance mechanosensitive channel